MRANYMKTLKRLLIIAFIVSLSVLGTKDVLARGHGHGHGHTSVFIGMSYGYPYRCWDCYGPYHFHPYWYDDYWMDDYVIVERPVVVERPSVFVEGPVLRAQTNQYTAQVGADTQKLFASIRDKKGELLKQLQIGDKASRMKAIAELAGLSYDEQVREKLEEVLLKDADPDLRKEVVMAFGKVKNEKVIAVLEKVRVGDSDMGVRQEADDAIRKIK